MAALTEGTRRSIQSPCGLPLPASAWAAAEPARNSPDQVTKTLGDVAWWCARLSFLRNKLMHGSPVVRDGWLHNDLSHIDLGEWYLRLAIKHTIAADGHASVLDSILHRAILAAIVARHEVTADPPTDGDDQPEPAE